MKSLRTLINTIDPQPDDELIFLGDYVDRGPDSRDVIDQMIQLRDRCQTVALRGNHEIMMLGVIVGGLDPTHWLANGGVSTLTSYGGTVSKIPEDHMSFFRDLLPYYEAENDIFVHACYDANLPMSEQTEHVMYWTHLGPNYPAPHQSGKRVFVGHTPQREVLDLGHLICLDTYCFGRGYLTAMDLDTCELVQVDYHGHLRRAANGTESNWFNWMGRKWNQFAGRFLSVRADDEGEAGSGPIPHPVSEPAAASKTKDEDLPQSEPAEQDRVS